MLSLPTHNPDVGNDLSRALAAVGLTTNECLAFTQLVASQLGLRAPSVPALVRQLSQPGAVNQGGPVNPARQARQLLLQIDVVEVARQLRIDRSRVQAAAFTFVLWLEQRTSHEHDFEHARKHAFKKDGDAAHVASRDNKSAMTLDTALAEARAQVHGGNDHCGPTEN